MEVLQIQCLADASKDMEVNKMVTKLEIKTALAAYKSANPGSDFSEDEKRFLLMRPGKPDIELSEDGGKFQCSDKEFGLSFKDEYLDEPVSTPAKYDNKRTNVPAVPGKPAKDIGSTIESWRAKQDRTYAVEGGKEVPNAFAASEAANLQKINIETDTGRTENLAWGKARAIDKETGQYREAKVNFEWTLFRQKTAWEIARSMEKKTPGIIKGAEEKTFLPLVDGTKTFKGQPAPLYLHMAVLNRWAFADRDAESKAERRAVLKLLNREWREKDEIDMEQAEEREVREMRT